MCGLPPYQSKSIHFPANLNAGLNAVSPGFLHEFHAIVPRQLRQVVTEKMENGLHRVEDGRRRLSVRHDFRDQRRLHLSHLFANGLHAIK